MSKKSIIVLMCCVAVGAYWLSQRGESTFEKPEMSSVGAPASAAPESLAAGESPAESLKEEIPAVVDTAKIEPSELEALADDTQYLKQIDQMEEDISDMNEPSEPTDVSAIYENF